MSDYVFTPDAKYLALQIQRKYPRESWANHIAALPDELREEAASFLRDIWRRAQLFVPRDAK